MTQRPAGLTRIDAVLRTVPNLDTAERFYREALGFVAEGGASEASKEERALLGMDEGQIGRRTLRLRHQRVILLDFQPQGHPYSADSTSSDLWFQHCAVVVGDMPRAYERVMRAGALPISRDGPQHLPANTGGVTAFKFRDPFGHPWELLGFPAGVGDPVWHEDREALFRGMDHTAIAVSSSEASSRFYAEGLGLAVHDRSHNRGPEQSRLDAIPADDVAVVALAPRSAPPHLELLVYRTGTRRPNRTAPNDMTVSRSLATGDVAAIAANLARRGHGMPATRRGMWDGRPAIAFEDPDGHRWICQAPS